MILGFIGSIMILLDKKFTWSMRAATLVLSAPFAFNVVALYLGHSVLFIQGLSGDSLFNVRYGIMMMPSFAIFIGYLAHRAAKMRLVFLGLMAFVTFFFFINSDAVTVDDARVGSSQKNVSEISAWLKQNTKEKPGFILISAASHDSVIFTSGLPMKKFIHEGTGDYYKSAISNPDRWARWIIMRTHSEEDSTWRAMKNHSAFINFELVDHYPFADVYQLKDEFIKDLNTEPILKDK